MPPKRSRSPETEEKTKTKKTKISPTKADKKDAVVKLSEPPTETAVSDPWLLELITAEDWRDKLMSCFETEKMRNLESWLVQQYEQHQVFPHKQLIFNAFNLTPFNSIKVVIIGQDPYHDDNQAHGLSFSVPAGVDVPRSLMNIYKELATDIAGFKPPGHGCLEVWAKRGVLLLNAALTVEAHKANSHARSGWWKFTDDVIKIISSHGNPCVFLLWGGFAHKKEPLIDAGRHRIIKTAHPSPLSVSKFKGCKCFSAVNQQLKELELTPIDWNLPEISSGTKKITSYFTKTSA